MAAMKRAPTANHHHRLSHHNSRRGWMLPTFNDLIPAWAARYLTAPLPMLIRRT